MVVSALAASAAVVGVRVVRHSSPGRSPPLVEASAPVAVAGGHPSAADGSVFAIVGGPTDEFGTPTTRGYAFVVHSSGGTSDLLADYHLVAERFLAGDETVELRHGDRTVVATIVAVSPDPHVAKLRIAGTHRALLTAPAPPALGSVVTLGASTDGTGRNAMVVEYSGPGAAGHLAFSVEVPNRSGGAPVFDGAGRVVGMAEPTVQFPVQDMGFATPIAAACAAVATC